jgi:Signal recognition particle GTPase
MNDMRDQLQQMLSMGGMASLMDKLPGVGNLPEGVKSKVNDKEVHRMVAIISSMTKKERRHPDLLNGSRKVRVRAVPARSRGRQPPAQAVHADGKDDVEAVVGRREGPDAPDGRGDERDGGWGRMPPGGMMPR